MTTELFGEYEEPAMPEAPRPPKASKQYATTGEPPAAPGAAAPGTPQVPFEDAFARLEALVAEMERGDLPLEGLLAKFEEGVGLVKNCQAFLRQAQLRVEQFVEVKDGAWVLKDTGETV
jgi:exodeoxyribonuclease VII small subunit